MMLTRRSYHRSEVPKMELEMKMDQSDKDFVLQVIDSANDMTLATVREDGYPQATTVSFAHDGLDLYVGVGKDSQKANNIRHNNKVSLAINLPYKDWREIKGLSMSGLAEIVDGKEGVDTAKACLLKRFPQIAQWTEAFTAEDVEFVRIRPQVISVLDYSKGFGHTELVTA
jgi:general stress protein 26